MINSIYGLVLSGGESSRMGSDKGLITSENKTWSQIAFEKLSVHCSKVFVSINPLQYEKYKTYFPENIILDSVCIKGPLCGLLSFYEKFPHKDVIILACDMLKITDKTLHLLYENYLKNPEKDFIIFKNDNQLEPLCGIYTSKGLKNVYENYQNNSLQNFSIKRILDPINTLFLNHSNHSELKNYNYPDY